MNYQIVINRKSGEGLFEEAAQQDRLKQIFTGRGHSVDLRVVEPDQLEAALKGKAESAGEVLIVGGGDGTITTAARLLHGTEKTLGVLPLGTFNLEARDLNIPLDPFAAAESLLDAETLPIDLLKVNGEYCLCTTVIGFYPALAKARESFHGSSWWVKSLRIAREIATVAVASPALNLTISAEGKTYHRRTRLTAFSPGSYEESVGLIPQRKNLASGKLTAYVSEHLSRGQMLHAALGYLTGKLLDMEKMTKIESSEIILDVKRRKTIPAMIDGEILRISLPCRLEILPRALNVLRPKSDPS
ncbi:MAG: diacylglycerol kinase family protein [Luteolibacter sp.]|uniref:diacylglycerol/lipid kinase family protein n=1 Tax=Luteolibacter sp. TaxID=1962973 RepID=UPI0032676DF9